MKSLKNPPPNEALEVWTRDMDPKAGITQAPQSTKAAPGWTVLLLVAYAAHLCEEWWGGPGLPAWATATVGAELEPSRFLAINTIALPLFTAGIIGAVRSRHFAWVTAVLASLFFVNGILHLFATVVFATYSPGTLTGALLFLPLGGLALVSMSRSLPGLDFKWAVFAGIALHTLATFSALA